jgi:hypothetical protein
MPARGFLARRPQCRRADFLRAAPNAGARIFCARGFVVLSARAR